MEPNEKTKLFQVRVESRLKRTKGKKFVRTSGKQGDWREEEKLVIAADGAEAEALVIAEIENRRILGKNAVRRAECKREVNIIEIRSLT